MSKFWYTASAVPRYQVASFRRCCAGSRSRNSFISGRRKDQPICRWRNRLCALYWLKIPMRRTPELMQLDNAKSIIRNLPPKNTAGLARRSVNCLSRLPRPPASTRAMDLCASLCWVRAVDNISASLLRRGRRDGARARALRQRRRAIRQAKGSAGDFGERLQLGLKNVLLPFEPPEFHQQGLPLGAGRPRNLLSQARQIALDSLQLCIDRGAIEFVRWDRFIGEHGATLRRHLGDPAGDKDAPGHCLAFVDIDRARSDRRDQWSVPRQDAKIAFGAGDH